MAFLLDLHQLRGPRDHFDATYPEESFGGTDEDFRVASPVELSMDIEKRDRREVHVGGTVRATLEVPCSRCLEPIVWPVDARFDLRYLPASSHAGGPEEEVSEEDLGVASYEGDQLDLEQLIREQFYLALPMKALCGPECQGLCPECGTNLNVSRCACEHRWVDPRLAALGQLLPKPRREH